MNIDMTEYSLILLTRENISKYESRMQPLIQYDINFYDENYIYVKNNVVIAYALIKQSEVIYDKKNKYINKKKYEIKDTKKFCNDFNNVPLECLYNLNRLQDKQYIGAGIAFIKEILAIKKIIYLATVEDKLYKYYKKAGFKETNYFDMDINGIYRKVLCWKQNNNN
jgi:tRNA G26 N,N-dimethylase Trm1